MNKDSNNLLITAFPARACFLARILSQSQQKDVSTTAAGGTGVPLSRAIKSFDHVEAARLTTEGISLYPQVPKYPLARATANVHLQKYSEAIAEARNILSLDPDNKIHRCLPYLNLGHTLLCLSDFDLVFTMAEGGSRDRSRVLWAETTPGAREGSQDLQDGNRMGMDNIWGTFDGGEMWLKLEQDPEARAYRHDPGFRRNVTEARKDNRKKSRQKLLEKAGVFVVNGDLNDRELLDKLFNVVVFTHVTHLAAQAGVRYAMQNPPSYINSNVAGLVNLLEVCKSANPQPAIVWASSSSAYGLNGKVPFSEKDRTDQPASLYAATKKAGEEITHSYNHIYGLSITGLRFFTVYCPWGRPDMAYFFFTKDILPDSLHILKGKEIMIYEGVDHSSVAQDFTYIDDVVKGCIAALDTAKKSTGSGGIKRGTAQFRIYNLGNTTPVPVTKLVSILEKLLKTKAKKKLLPLPRNGDVKFTHANITLAQKELGYRPNTDLETGLKKFVNWYISHYQEKKSSW